MDELGSVAIWQPRLEPEIGGSVYPFCPFLRLSSSPLLFFFFFALTQVYSQAIFPR